MSTSEKDLEQVNSDHKEISYEQINDLATLPSESSATADPNNPLYWPLWTKIMILTQVSLLAALGGLNTATVNPALNDLAEEFGITTVRASYQTTVCIALNGVAPWLWIPFANKYGRRPVYLFTTFLAFASILGCSYATSFATLVVARVFNGLFPVAFALGASTVTDLFFAQQRGRAMGFFTITMATGSHIAPIVGGLIGGYVGWRWIFKFISIVDAVMFLTSLVCLPETLYIQPSRTHSVTEDKAVIEPHISTKIYLAHLRPISPLSKQMPPLRPLRFLLATLRLSWYPSILLPALYYATNYGFASILPAVTVAAIFKPAYGWKTLKIGLTYGTSLTVGGILGEFCSGWVVDALYIRAQRRHVQKHQTGHAPPEVRLAAIWPGEILVTVALLMYGFTLHYHGSVSWFAPIFAIGLGCFGLQIITTTCYTYAIDCYREHSSEVAQVFNFARQMFGMTFAFYAVDVGEEIGFHLLFVIYAILGGVVAFIGILLVMWKGQQWRERIART